MKKILSLTLALTLALSLTACGGDKPAESKAAETGAPAASEAAKPGSNEAPVTIKIATTAADGSIINTFLYKITEEVDAALPGRVEWKYYTNGSLGSEREIGEAIINKDVDAAIVAPSVMNAVVPLKIPNIQDAFFLFHGVEHMYKVADAGYREALAAEYAPYGMVNVALLWSVPQEIGNNVRPIKVPEDIKGLKIRSNESVGPFSFLEGAGAIPVNIPMNELYTSMEQGTVDGAFTSRSVFGNSNKMAEVTKYYSSLACTTTGWALTFNEEIFNGLAEDIQQAILDAGKTAEDWMRYEYSQGLAEKDIEYMESCGCEIYTPTEEEMELWQAAAEEYSWPKIKELVGDELWEQALEWSKVE